MIASVISTLTDITGKQQRLEKRLKRKEKRQEKLHQHTQQLSDNVRDIMNFVEKLPDLVIKIDDNKICYETEAGECYGEGILKEDNFAIQKAFMSKGTIFPLHSHEEYELLIVVSGQLTAYFDGGRKTVVAGEVVYFEPNQEHKITADSDTWMFGITIPAGEGYPDAG